MKHLVLAISLLSVGGCRFLIDVQPDLPGERVRVTLRNSSQYTIWLEQDGVPVRKNQDRSFVANGDVVRIPPGGIHVIRFFSNDQWGGSQGTLVAKYEVPGELYAKASEPAFYSIQSNLFTQHYQTVVYEPGQPMEVVWLDQPAHYPGYMRYDSGYQYYGGSYSYGPVYTGGYRYYAPSTNRRCKR